MNIEVIDGPILDPKNFITYAELCTLLTVEQFPMFLADMLARNKMKTKRLVVDGKEYRVYYKWSHELDEFVYYFDKYGLFFVLRPSGQEGHYRFFVLVEEGSSEYEPFKSLLVQPA